jgi:transposase
MAEAEIARHVETAMSRWPLTGRDGDSSRRPHRAGRKHRAGADGIEPSAGGVRGGGIPDGLPENPRAVLEAKRHSSEEKIRIVLDGLRGEASIAELCRREGIAESLYYAWSKEFLEAGKRRLAGDTARAATSGEVKDLRREAQELKAVVAEQTLELRLLKKSMIADGGDEE